MIQSILYFQPFFFVSAGVLPAVFALNKSYRKVVPDARTIEKTGEIVPAFTVDLLEAEAFRAVQKVE